MVLFKCVKLFSYLQPILQGALNAGQMNSSKPMTPKTEARSLRVTCLHISGSQATRNSAKDYVGFATEHLWDTFFLSQKLDSGARKQLAAFMWLNVFPHSHPKKQKTFWETPFLCKIERSHVFSDDLFRKKNNLHDIRGLTIATWIAGFGCLEIRGPRGTGVVHGGS